MGQKENYATSLSRWQNYQFRSDDIPLASAASDLLAGDTSRIYAMSTDNTKWMVYFPYLWSRLELYSVFGRCTIGRLANRLSFHLPAYGHSIAIWKQALMFQKGRQDLLLFLNGPREFHLLHVLSARH